MTALSAEASVLKVITDANRPFGLQNLVDLTAHMGLKKAAVTKAIDALVEQGKVTAKDFGKTKIYLPPQGGLVVMSKEEAAAKKQEVQALQAQLQKEAAQAREAEQELAQLKSAMTEEQIQQQTGEATKKLKEAEARLALLRSGAVLITPEEREAVAKALGAAMDAWRKRRGMFKAIWGSISEGIDGKQSVLFEEAGVETDEAAGVDMAACERLAAKKRKF